MNIYKISKTSILILLLSLLAFPSISQSGISVDTSDSQIDSLSNLISISENIKAETYNSLSKLYIKKDVLLSIYYAEEALKLANKEKDEDALIYALYNLGIGYFKNKELSKALYYYEKTLELIKDESFRDLKMIVLNNIGNVYGENNDHEKSFEYYKRILDIVKENEDSLLLSRVYNNIGIVYMNKKEFNKSVECLHKSLAYQKKSDNIDVLIIAYNNLALTYAEAENYDSTLAYLKTAMALAEEHELDEFILGISQEYCELYELLGDYPKSIKYGERSKKLIEKYQKGLRHKDLYRFLYRVYEKNNENEKAFINSKIHSYLVDSLYEIERKIQLNIVENRLQSENIIKKLNNERILKEEKLKRQQLYISFLVIISIIVLIILLLLRHQNRQKRIRILLEKDLITKDNLRLEVERRLEEEEKNRYKETIESKERELALTTLHITHKNQILNDINAKLENLLSEVKNRVRPELVDLRKLIKESLSLDNDWNNFKLHFEKVHPYFFERLKKSYPDITTNELKHCAYIKINLTVKEIARMLTVTPSAIKSAHYRLQLKMNIPENKSLSVFIQEF